MRGSPERRSRAIFARDSGRPSPALPSSSPQSVARTGQGWAAWARNRSLLIQPGHVVRHQLPSALAGVGTWWSPRRGQRRGGLLLAGPGLPSAICARGLGDPSRRTDLQSRMGLPLNQQVVRQRHRPPWRVMRQRDREPLPLQDLLVA